jgi:hypothetical protein
MPGKRRGEVAPVKSRSYGLEENPLGYAGVIVKVPTRSDGVSEIQIGTPAMIYGKESPPTARSILGKERWDKITQT